jgi:hypothetical protein
LIDRHRHVDNAGSPDDSGPPVLGGVPRRARPQILATLLKILRTTAKNTV